MSPVEIDLESRVKGDEHLALKLWLCLLSCTNRVETVVRKRLAQEFDTTLPRFDLMAQLERHPQGLSMGELSQRMMVTGGNVTGVTDQLEGEGLVQRHPHPSDRRALVVKLTPTGKRLFKRMASTHESWIAELLGGLAISEQAQMHELLATLKQALSSQAQTQQQVNAEKGNTQ